MDALSSFLDAASQYKAATRSQSMRSLATSQSAALGGSQDGGVTPRASDSGSMHGSSVPGSPVLSGPVRSLHHVVHTGWPCCHKYPRGDLGMMVCSDDVMYEGNCYGATTAWWRRHRNDLCVCMLECDLCDHCACLARCEPRISRQNEISSETTDRY